MNLRCYGNQYGVIHLVGSRHQVAEGIGAVLARGHAGELFAVLYQLDLLSRKAGFVLVLHPIAVSVIELLARDGQVALVAEILS